MLHLSPTVTVAALRSARRQDMNLSQWLEYLVMDGALTDADSQDTHHLGHLLAVQLFAHIASTSPGTLAGRWKLLFERCKLTPELWHYPNLSLAEIEAGEDDSPKLNSEVLLRLWPTLVSNVWLAD